MSGMRRLAVLALLAVLAGCSSGGPTTPAPSSTNTAAVQALIRPLMRADVDQLAAKDDATLDRVAVQQCTDLVKDGGYLTLLKGDLLSGIPAKQAGALIAYAVRGWCPSKVSLLPGT